MNKQHREERIGECFSHRIRGGEVNLVSLPAFAFVCWSCACKEQPSNHSGTFESPFQGSYTGAMRTPKPLAIMVAALLAMGTSQAQDNALPDGLVQMPPEAHTWVELPDMPPGVKVLLLEGSPKKESMFTMRLRIPAGMRVEPHWHPRDERVTILSGMAKVGFGDTWDEGKMTTFGPGSFYLNPPMSHHYVLIVEDTEMQLTGMGPWELHYLAK